MADLHLGAGPATADEIAAVARVVGDPTVVHVSSRAVRAGTRRRHDRRHLLLPALHALQEAAGWISPGGVDHVADVLQVPPAEAHGVATFYAMFSTTPPAVAGDITHVCVDPVCRIEGGEDRARELEARGIRVHRSPCLGRCERAPATYVQGVGRPDPIDADAAEPTLCRPDDPAARLLARVGTVDPTSLAAYRAAGGFTALARAVERGGRAVVDEIETAGLTGRGGAAFPTAVKWRAVASEPGPRLGVLNADESEPGTFKDRVLLEHDPFAVVEAMLVAAVATGAEQGWIYVRGEYPLVTARLESAVAQCRAEGLLGGDGSGAGHPFDIEIRRGAGAYICGEETALFASIEGYRGEPRGKPPFPTTQGLFGRPTAVNNPETLLGALAVVAEGAEAFRARGTDGSPGTKLFSVAGRVARPGVVEVDFGTTLGAVIEAAGGVTGTGELGAVLLGGAAGAFVGADRLDLPLTLEDARASGLTLGSGAVMVFDTGVDLTDVLVRLAAFFRDESCGQCVPCRIGTVRQHETMVQLQRSGALTADRLAVTRDLAAVMADASICGLGHTAASAVTSAIALGLIEQAP